MTEHRIADIQLDAVSLIRYRDEVELERKVAIYDLLEDNYFELSGCVEGPYLVQLGVAEGNRLIIDVRDAVSRCRQGLFPDLRKLFRCLEDANSKTDRNHRYGAPGPAQ